MALTTDQAHVMQAPKPRFGGVLWRMAPSSSTWGERADTATLRRSPPDGLADGFVISLAFGAQVDWYRNLAAAAGGTIRARPRMPGDGSGQN